MITKYEDSRDKGYAYVKFHDLGLTKNAIDKLVQFYGSADAAVAVVEAALAAVEKMPEDF